MKAIQQDRCKNMIIGALVADAAAMGLHWIYDQARIRKVAGDTPEFMTPDPQHYADVPAFFAHPNRAAGACSQYGEQTMVMLRSLVASQGQYDRADFFDQFRAHFGYGGAYVGYIDHATRDTLDNARRFEDAAYECAKVLPFDADPRIPKQIVAKALPLLLRHSGDELRKAFYAAMRSNYDDDAVVIYAMKLLEALDDLPHATGAYDLQLPAIAKLPALVALLAAQSTTDDSQFDIAISSAVAVTSDHPTAKEYGKITAHLMLGAIKKGTSTGAIAMGLSVASTKPATLLEEAIAMKDKDSETATKHFGMACDLPYGVPSATHIIASATTYSNAIRHNIYSGGDTCGRAILVGAVMGAIHGIGGTHGIPQHWIDQLEMKAEANQLLADLFDK